MWLAGGRGGGQGQGLQLILSWGREAWVELGGQSIQFSFEPVPRNTADL